MSKLKNPYPGIRPFRTEESHLFFGREPLIKELRERLNCKFLTIVGTSGSGKSSLVRAGVIPQLLDEGWTVAHFRPQDSPILNLFSTLCSGEVLGKYLDEDTRISYKLGKTTSIAQLYEDSKQEKPLVLVVDQFEEIFRYKIESSENKEVSIRFVEILLEAIEQSELPIYVAITLRSEFLGRCSEFKGLAEWINQGQYLVPRLSRTQFQRAILGFKDHPEYEDVNMSSLLVTKLLNDIEDDPDQLPVLQHALRKTWRAFRKSDSNEITIEHYESTGEMAKAVSIHAESILKELRYQGLEDITKVIFQRITEIDLESNKVRNPTPLATLVELAGGKRQNVVTIIEAFRKEGRNFLMPYSNIPLENETMIDIAHESLIRQWRTLGKWMREEEENAREYKLINSRREFQETEGWLQNPRLAISDYWWIARNPTVVWASRYHSIDPYKYNNQHKKLFRLNEEFLDQSKEEQEKINQANKSEVERKREQKVQRVTYLSVGMMIIVLTMALFLRRNKILKDEAIASAQIAINEALQADSARLIAVNATDQALIEKTIADSLRVEADIQTLQLAVTNKIADSLKNQAIAERGIAENRSMDARIAEFGALLSETLARANGIQAGIFQVTSEYKENIQEAKKQALASLNIEDLEDKRANALNSFEKFDRYNKMLMGYEQPYFNNDNSVDNYIKSIDSIRASLNDILYKSNLWIKEVDRDLPSSFNTFQNKEKCELQIELMASTKEILGSRTDSLMNLKTSYRNTCETVETILTDRVWVKEYPVENHQALLDAYLATFDTRVSNINLSELTSFSSGGFNTDFEIDDFSDETLVTPRYIAVDEMGNFAHADNRGKITIESSSKKFEYQTEQGNIRFITLLHDEMVAVGQSASTYIIDPGTETGNVKTLEHSSNLIGLIATDGELLLGLNEKGNFQIWNDQGQLKQTIEPNFEDRISSFDCFKDPKTGLDYLAVGTIGGRIHLLHLKGDKLINTNLQFNRLYGGDEPLVRTVKFSPNGFYLATSTSKQLDIWPLTFTDNQNAHQLIFGGDIAEEQIEPISLGRNENIQTSKGISGICFDKNSDYLMYSNNSELFIKPVNIYFMCQNLGSDYCAGSISN